MVRLLSFAASAQRTVVCRKAFAVKRFPLLLAFGLLCFPCPDTLEAQAQVTRIVVQKKKIVAAWISGSPFAAVSSARPALAGFIQLADYPSRTVFEGPDGSVQPLIDSLKSEGYEVRLAADLESLSFQGHRIDPDTGAATPTFPSPAYQPSGTRGLFILVLRSYSTSAWFTALDARGVRLIESLSPAAYVARMDRSMAAVLKEEL